MARLLSMVPLVICVTGLMLVSAACSRNAQPVPESRFVEPDKLYQVVETNIRKHAAFEVIADIDHARLAAKAGSPMPPAHVLIWSDAALEAAILKHNPLAAVDLPLRILAFEDPSTGKAAVIANSFDYIASRHSLPEDDGIRRRYEAALAKAMEGIPAGAMAPFPSDRMSGTGLVTLDSPHDVATTEKRVLDAIKAQSDTVIFGKVDFAARSEAHGVKLEPLCLILFGGPGPGGKAMRTAPTLGLDAFCQKLLIWQDAAGRGHVTWNDLLALAERQGVSGGLPLRIINRRIKETFSEALKP